MFVESSFQERAKELSRGRVTVGRRPRHSKHLRKSTVWAKAEEGWVRETVSAPPSGGGGGKWRPRCQGVSGPNHTTRPLERPLTVGKPSAQDEVARVLNRVKSREARATSLVDARETEPSNLEAGIKQPPSARRIAETAWLLDWPDLPLAQSLPYSIQLAQHVSKLRAEAGPPWSELEDLVPGAGNLLLSWPARAVLYSRSLEHSVQALAQEAPELSLKDPPSPRIHRVPVLYRGADLPWVAQQVGLTPEKVAELHAANTYIVAFLGFSPGFPYLFGLCEELQLPRRSRPRPRVPAGSVAIAGPFSAIYPQATPGGWHLLGQTPFRCFEPSADPPCPLSVGDRVQFEIQGF